MLAPIIHVVGARPNFVKAAPVVAALATRAADQAIVHTGQHYDLLMSDVFFTELGIPRPDVELGVGSGSHGRQTGALLVALEEQFIQRSPALVVAYGDVNSTLAAALAAAKLGIPVAHVEAGLRSFDPSMPEEINRRLTDQIAGLHFATSAEAVGHLADEGLPVSGIHLVGNPMIDTLLANRDRFDAGRHGDHLPERYVVVTLHRPSNVDHPRIAGELVSRLHEVAELCPLVLPAHPRGRPALEAAGLARHPRVHVCEPLPYLAFLGLVQNATAVITDSGGVQEETTVLGVPCLTLRDTTERPVTISHGTNRLVTPEDLVSAASKAISERAGETAAGPPRRPPLWDGHAGERIADVIAEWRP